MSQEDQRRDERLELRVSRSELDRWKAAACEQSLSEWVRSAVRKQLELSALNSLRQEVRASRRARDAWDGDPSGLPPPPVHALDEIEAWSMAAGSYPTMVAPDAVCLLHVDPMECMAFDAWLVDVLDGPAPVYLHALTVGTRRLTMNGAASLPCDRPYRLRDVPDLYPGVGAIFELKNHGPRAVRVVVSVFGRQPAAVRGPW